MLFSPRLSSKDSQPEQRHVLVKCGTHGCSRAGHCGMQAADAVPGSLRSQQTRESTMGRRKKNSCCYYSTNFIR